MTSRSPSPTAGSAQQATADWLHLDQQLCFALYSTSLAMTKLYKPLLAPLGLTYPQYLALLVLWERDGLGVGELGERLFLDSGTLTPLLKRMETAGWLRRARDVADERRVVVKLTPEGRALRQRAKRVPPQLGQAMQCDLQDINSLTQRLQQLRANLLDAAAGDAAAAH
jgi:MarR family transcriptional regulator, organic hydroperoxide resistance regulator